MSDIREQWRQAARQADEWWPARSDKDTRDLNDAIADAVAVVVLREAIKVAQSNGAIVTTEALENLLREVDPPAKEEREMQHPPRPECQAEGWHLCVPTASAPSEPERMADGRWPMADGRTRCPRCQSDQLRRIPELFGGNWRNYCETCQHIFPDHTPVWSAPVSPAIPPERPPVADVAQRIAQAGMGWCEATHSHDNSKAARAAAREVLIILRERGKDQRWFTIGMSDLMNELLASLSPDQEIPT